MTEKTIVHHAASDHFETGLRAFFAYRDLGIRDASKGRIGAHVIRAVPETHAQAQWHTHALDFQMVYVLRGWVEFDYADLGRVRLEAGSCVYQPPGIPHRELAHSDNIEMLEITSPAVFETTLVAAPGRAA